MSARGGGGDLEILRRLFAEEGARAWCRAANADPRYREAGRRWEGLVVLTLASRGGESRSIYMDLAGGECHGAGVATPEHHERARVAISGRVGTWLDVLRGKLDPLLGITVGSLSLERGSMLTLMPHAKGAKVLVGLARQVAREVAEHPGDTAPEEVDARVGGHAGRPTGAGGGEEGPSRRSFRTVDGPGLDLESHPMRLFQKAKKLGVWDPRAVDLRQDARDWAALSGAEREVLLHLTTLFQAGEEAVTLELLPLVQVIAREGRLEEEMFLTAFLFEEAKHVETFHRFLREVAPDHGDLSRFAAPAYRRIFQQELPDALGALHTDSGPRSQARAAVTYNLVVEGVLAETGYHAYGATLQRNGILPGMQKLLRLVKRDESRHIAFGLHLLLRLRREHGEEVWHSARSEMGRLLEPALDVVREVFDAHDPMPFGLELSEFVEYAVARFRSRMEVLERGVLDGAPAGEGTSGPD